MKQIAVIYYIDKFGVLHSHYREEVGMKTCISEDYILNVPIIYASLQRIIISASIYVDGISRQSYRTILYLVLNLFIDDFLL